MRTQIHFFIILSIFVGLFSSAVFSKTQAASVSSDRGVITGIGYTYGGSNSLNQPFAVNATGTFGDIITVTCPTNYELSTTSNFSSSSSKLTFTLSSSTLAKTAYIRLKANLLTLTYLGNLTLTHSVISVNPLQIWCQNFITGGPVINVTDKNGNIGSGDPNPINSFTYLMGNGPSNNYTFPVTASQITSGNVVASLPSGSKFEFQTSAAPITYGSGPINLIPSAGNVSSNIIIRLKAGLTGPNNYIDSVWLSAPGVPAAAIRKVPLNGNVTVLPPQLTLNYTTIDRLNCEKGTTNCFVRSFIINATHLLNPLTISPTVNYEISLTPSGNFIAQSPITLNPLGDGSLTDTIYVRMKPNASLAQGNYTGSISFVSGSFSQIVNCLSTVYVVNAESINSQNSWKSLPLLSQSEYNARAMGGEGEQLCHGFSRCLNHPNYVYAAQDVMGTWRSTDGGASWIKNQDLGNYIPLSASIEVDPVDSSVVYYQNNHGWWYLEPTPSNPYTYGFAGIPSLTGLYRSSDFGSHWTQVINCVSPIDIQLNRRMRNLMTWSRASMATPKTSPTRWYAAFDLKALYRSDNSGVNGSWNKVSDIVDTMIVNVVAHPSQLNTVYLCTGNGLQKSTDAGVTFTHDTTFKNDTVINLLINPQNPQLMYAVVYNGNGKGRNGLYKSTNGGTSWSIMPMILKNGYNATGDCINAFMNPGFPSQIYWIASRYLGTFSCITNDGGATWSNSITNDPSVPGLSTVTRRNVAGEWCSVSPDPTDPSKPAAATSGLACMDRVMNPTSTSPICYESTGFTGNAWTPDLAACNFHPTDPNKYILSCNDIGPRTTLNNGLWFQPMDPVLSQWKDEFRISWTGSYSAAFQPQNGTATGSQVVVASIGMYNGGAQLMRSKNYGVTWDSCLTVKPLYDSNGHTIPAFYWGTDAKYKIQWDVKAKRQDFKFIGFDPQVGYENYCYAGNQISTNAGIKFDSIKTWIRSSASGVSPIVWDNGSNPATNGGYASETPQVVGISKDLSGNSHIFATGGQYTHIYRSDDHGASWIIVYPNPDGYSLVQLDRNIAFAVHPTDPNTFFVMHPTSYDIAKVVYNPSMQMASVTDLHSFSAISPNVPFEVYSSNKVRSIALDPVDPNVIYVAMSISGIPNVYRTLDGGNTWSSISDNSTLSCHEGMLKVNPFTRELYRGSMSGTYIYPAPSTTGITTNIGSNNIYSRIRLYVNQSEGQLTVFDANNSDKFDILDLTGKAIVQFVGNTTSINQLLPGIYMVKSNKHPTEKFVKF